MKIDQIFDPILEYHDTTIPEKSGPYLAFTPVQRLREYKTVRIGVGRQKGHSFYISRTAGPKDLILCRSSFDVETMSKRCEIHNVSGCSEVYAQNKLNLVPDKGFRNIWIDDASHIPDKTLADIYTKFAGKCHRIILVH